MERTFFKYISLNMLGALGLSGYIMADTYFVANRLGADGLAALNLAIPVFGLVNGLGILLGMGGATRYSICRYQEDHPRAHRAFTMALLWGAGLGLLLALLGAFAAGPIAGLLGAEGDSLPLCAVYLRTVLMFAPCFLLNQVMIAFVRNDGNPKLAMTAMLTGSLANIVLDYLFLFPLDLGIFGAALATGTAPVIGLCLSSLHVLTGRNQFRPTVPAAPLRALGDMAGLGSAAFINEFTSCMVLALYNVLMLQAAGTTGVAAYGIVANLALMAARRTVAECLGAKPEEIYFTGCGTESDNWAITEGARLGAAAGKKHIISDAIEHHAVLHTLAKLEKQGFEVTYLPVHENGIVRLEELAAAIRPDTCLVTIMYSNNEIGTIQPVREIGALCREKGILFHCDAVQAVGHMPVDVEKDNIDMLALSGPQGRRRSLLPQGH